MSSATASASSTPRDTTQAERENGHVGLVVLGSIGLGLVVGLLLVLAVFAAGAEHEITGSALIALGSGFVALALASGRLTNQPQPWALAPGLATAALGLGIVLLAPSDRMLGLAGWVWPVLLLILVGWSFRGAQRTLDSWSCRALLYPALVVLALVAIGGVSQAVADATSSNPMPPGGRTYVVDGHRLYLNCAGSGTPTVVLFNGLGERTPSWARVRQELSDTTRVCVFDRAGQGWSGPAPRKQDGRQLASDAHELLRAAGIPGPYVLAGHSVGGTYALVYADRYPEQVAGVALIDSSTPDQFDLPDYPGFYSTWRRVSALFPSLARAGIARVTLGTGFASLPADARDQARAFASSPRELRADRLELAELPAVLDQAKALRSLGDKPLAVLTADRDTQRGWTAAQDRLARLSDNSVHRTVSGSTHAGLLEDRRFASITALAIGDVVRLVRSGRR